MNQGPEKEELAESSILSPISILPSETILHIMSYLSAKELKEMEQVNHLFRMISNEPSLWRALLKKDFTVRTEIELKPAAQKESSDEENTDEENNEKKEPVTQNNPEVEPRVSESKVDAARRLKAHEFPKLTYHARIANAQISLVNKYLILKEIIVSNAPVKMTEVMLRVKRRLYKKELESARVKPEERDMHFSFSFLEHIDGISSLQVKRLLSSAAKSGNITMVERMLDSLKGEDVKYMLRRMLEIASTEGNLDLVKFLITVKKVQILKDSLIYAVNAGEASVVDFLLLHKEKSQGQILRFLENTILTALDVAIEKQKQLKRKKKEGLYLPYQKIITSLTAYFKSEYPLSAQLKEEPESDYGEESHDQFPTSIISYYKSQQCLKKRTSESERADEHLESEPEKEEKLVISTKNNNFSFNQ